MRSFLPAKADTTGEQPAIDWIQCLVLFFRAVAIFQLCKGMLHWALIIGASDAGPAGDQAVEYLAANIYFAVLDPVAGVGLWMTSSWGAVLWLLAAISQIAVCLGFAEVYGFLWPVLLLEAGLVGIYIFLTWKVAQFSEE